MPPIRTTPPQRSASLARLAIFARRLSPAQASAIVVGAVVATGVLNILLGPGLSLELFYATAIAFAAWRFGRHAGYATVGLVAGFALLADRRHAVFGIGAPPSGEAMAVEAWNLASSSAGALLLAILADALRAAIEYERARASVDGLTGALNRSAFVERLPSAMRAARRGPSGWMLACVDLDGFKAVNDVDGHAAGDRLLAEFVRGVAAGLGAGELIARAGGDEFLLLVALPPGEEVRRRADRLQRQLGDALAGCRPAVTCSTGAVPLPGPDDAGASEEALLAAADALMYEVKRAGRDAVRVPAAFAARLVRDPA